MEIVGRTLLKGKVAKQLKKFSGEQTNEVTENSEEGVSEEDMERIKEMKSEKREIMEAQQLVRRTERAKVREEIRKRHKIESSENDSELIRSSGHGNDAGGDSTLADIASSISERLKSVWESVGGSIGKS